MAWNNKALRSTAGQTFGTGGDYFTPGNHLVRVDEVSYFESKENPGEGVFLVKGVVLHSRGGSHVFEMNNGVPVSKAPTPAQPMRVGAAFSWIQKDSNKQIFPTRVGNFTLAVKQAFSRFTEGQGAGKDAFIDKVWTAADERVRVRKFLAQAKANPTTTVETDAEDVVDLGLADGVVLKVTCAEAKTKTSGKIITNSAFELPSKAELDMVDTVDLSNGSGDDE